LRLNFACRKTADLAVFNRPSLVHTSPADTASLLFATASAFFRFWHDGPRNKNVHAAAL
jgi:hypothetical protein